LGNNGHVWYENLLPTADCADKRDATAYLAEKMLTELQQRNTLTVAEALEALEALGANRNTVKVKFTEPFAAGLVRLCGQGREAHYRKV